ncbi:MAG: hypothetical protein ACJ8R9_23890 [Steroidobacteraceae bacterium]
MTFPETDDEFETYLKRRTVLPNGMSDHDKLEPPKALDASVLKEAREAVHAHERLSRAPRWARPVALAATILLCLSILLNVSLHTTPPTANLRQMTASTADTAAPTATGSNSEGEPHDNAANRASSPEAILPEAKVVEPRAARPPVLAEANTPAPDDTRRAHGTAVDKATAFPKGSSTAYSPAPTNVAPPETAAEKAAKFADRAGIPVQGMSEARSTADSAADEPDQLAKRNQAPGQAPAASSPPGNASLSAATPAIPPGERAAEAQKQDEPTALAQRKAAARGPHPSDPKAWLQQITALRAAGKTAQADAEMERFRAAFPAYPAKPDPPDASEAPK